MNGAGASTAVDVSGLSVRFGAFAALDGVSFAIPAGSITGLVGPNGAGKTTLLRVLATLLVPSKGTARVAGVDVVRRANEVRRMIGYLPDLPGIYQDMTVVEYLRFFADAHLLDAASRDKFMKKALDVSGLGARTESFIEDLSRGMRAKLCFARALAGDPRVLLLDEPLANLDAVARADMLETIATMRGEGRTVIVSSHILSDLERLCDGVLFIHGGRLMDEDSRTGARPEAFRLRVAENTNAEALSAIAGVAAAAPTSDSSAWLLTLSAGADPRAVLREVLDRGLSVIEWKSEGRSLEQRLVSIVREKTTE